MMNFRPREVILLLLAGLLAILTYSSSLRYARCARLRSAEHHLASGVLLNLPKGVMGFFRFVRCFKPQKPSNGKQQASG